MTWIVIQVLFYICRKLNIITLIDIIGVLELECCYILPALELVVLRKETTIMLNKSELLNLLHLSEDNFVFPLENYLLAKDEIDTENRPTHTIIYFKQKEFEENTNEFFMYEAVSIEGSGTYFTITDNETNELYLVAKMKENTTTESEDTHPEEEAGPLDEDKDDSINKSLLDSVEEVIKEQSKEDIDYHADDYERPLPPVPDDLGNQELLFNKPLNDELPF